MLTALRAAALSDTVIVTFPLPGATDTGRLATPHTPKVLCWYFLLPAAKGQLEAWEHKRLSDSSNRAASEETAVGGSLSTNQCANI